MRFLYAISASLLALGLTQCRDPARSHRWFAMDCNMALSLYGKRGKVSDDSVFAAVERETARLEGVFSDYSAASAVSRIKGDSGDTVQADAEVYDVLGSALAFGRVSGGAFDITLHDLKALWDIGGGRQGNVPAPQAIDAAMWHNPAYRRNPSGAQGPGPDAGPMPVELLPDRRVILLRDSVQLDLGAIAKGYIVDRLHDLLDSLGHPDHMIQAGGEIRLGGGKGGSPWLVGIRHPRSGDSLAGMITTEGPLSISTSGDYERFFLRDGIRYHHIFDPRTGSPSRASCAVTVAAGSSIDTDALSTALFVLGPESGAALARRIGAWAVWFLERPEGICARAMPEWGSALALKGVPACPDFPAGGG